MSYIINSTSPFVSIKLTEIGREKIATGTLNYAYWSVGDSEIDYNMVSGTSKVLRPVDQQPNIKYFISTSGGTPLNTVTGANVRTLKAVINNKSDERGFFSGVTTTGSTILTTNGYVDSFGNISGSNFIGGKTINITSGLTVGDIIMFQLTNPIIGSLSGNTQNKPIPTLFYKIQGTTGSTISVDRNLPNLSGYSGTTIQYYIYPGGEVSTAFGTGTTSAYWNKGTLTFEQNDTISIADNPVWCMNNVWAETMVGITTGYRDYKYFGSYQFLGEKETYFEFGLSDTALNNTSMISCSDFSSFDTTCKSLSLIHYTNNTISNFYGEYFYINNLAGKIFEINLPTLMYNRRNYSTGSGTTMGMRFIATGLTQTVGVSDLQYIDLIEDPALVCGTPNIIGRVYPQLKMVSIHDEEIIAATSYKSNRNWTLPQLDAKTWTPVNGVLGGILPVGSTIYLTYVLENNTTLGLTNSLACQKYVKLTNTTTSAKDVVFNIDGTNMFPYMRKIESGYDGLGFYAYNFKLLYQIISDTSTRPNPNNWNVVDFTSNIGGWVSGQTINPSSLETGFYTLSQSNSGVTYNNIVNDLNIPLNADANTLNFGDERFFYGNIKTYIGATVYKTIFSINLDGSYNKTTNPTRLKTSTDDMCVTEVGIYDSSQELVAIGKMSEAIKYNIGGSITIELGLDF